MQHVTSPDGTTIAVDSMGAGPPLVMVLGAFCDRRSGETLAQALAPDYTVYRYDRRGRGCSGDHPPYSIEREVDDLRAVVSIIPGEPVAYGHSSGGALALEAVASGLALRRLAVYEPPYVGAGDPARESARELDRLVSAGRRGEAAERFLASTGAPPDVIAGVKASPDWARMKGLAHTLSRDRNLNNGGSVPATRFASIAVPVLAIAGGASAPWARSAMNAIARAIPHGETRTMEHQHHVPADAALAPVLTEFFV